MRESRISWTDHTFNPWMGCQKVSAACDHCYAESMATRFGHAEWGPHAARQRTSASYWRQPLSWNRAAERAGTPSFVFCASMADVFDNKVPGQWREDLWQVVEDTRFLVWLLLTKRPQNAPKMVPAHWHRRWPPHVWAGTTVETEAEAARRLPHLKALPAPRRFVSYEPALERVDWRRWLDGIDWMITGCESRQGKRPGRPSELGCFRDTRDQCAAAGTAFWLKQMAVDGRVVETPELDGVRHTGRPAPLSGLASAA